MKKLLVGAVLFLFSSITYGTDGTDNTSQIIMNCANKVELYRQLTELNMTSLEIEFVSERTGRNNTQVKNFLHLFTNNKKQWILVEQVGEDRFCGLAFGNSLVRNKL